MIELEVISSPDKEMLGRHVYFKNVLNLGINFGDILFHDQDVIDGHLRIEFTPEGPFCYKSANVTHYLLNGKRTTGKRLISVDDQIKIGSTTFKVSAFLFISTEKKKSIINRNLNAIINDSDLSDVREIFDQLEQDLAKIS